MSDGFQYFDIIFFALIAVFVILRLRRALGRRTGQERRPTDIFSRSTEPEEHKSGKVIHLPALISQDRTADQGGGEYHADRRPRANLAAHFDEQEYFGGREGEEEE